MLLFHNTHAYLRCRASLPEGAMLGVGPVIVGFSDGTEVIGDVSEGGPDHLTLMIGPYQTARGTVVPCKILRLTADAQGWTVAARLA